MYRTRLSRCRIMDYKKERPVKLLQESRMTRYTSTGLPVELVTVIVIMGS